MSDIIALFIIIALVLIFCLYHELSKAKNEAIDRLRQDVDSLRNANKEQPHE